VKRVGKFAIKRSQQALSPVLPINFLCAACVHKRGSGGKFLQHKQSNCGKTKYSHDSVLLRTTHSGVVFICGVTLHVGQYSAFACFMIEKKNVSFSIYAT
jgi:hypothetical protein